MGWGSWLGVIYSGCPLQWRHNDHDGVSNYQPHGCLLNRSFRRKSKKTSKLRVTGLCAGNSPGPVNSPHKGPVTRNMFPFDDVILYIWDLRAFVGHFGVSSFRYFQYPYLPIILISHLLKNIIIHPMVDVNCLFSGFVSHTTVSHIYTVEIYRTGGYRYSKNINIYHKPRSFWLKSLPIQMGLF